MEICDDGTVDIAPRALAFSPRGSPHGARFKLSKKETRRARAGGAFHLCFQGARPIASPFIHSFTSLGSVSGGAVAYSSSPNRPHPTRLCTGCVSHPGSRAARVGMGSYPRGARAHESGPGAGTGPVTSAHSRLPSDASVQIRGRLR